MGVKRRILRDGWAKISGPGWVSYEHPDGRAVEPVGGNQWELSRNGMLCKYVRSERRPTGLWLWGDV